MTTVSADREHPPAGLRRRLRRLTRRLRLELPWPKGLYTRSLLIVILPVVLLQAVVASVFVDRHWELMTRRLSSAVAQDIGAIVSLYRAAPDAAARARVIAFANEKLSLNVAEGPPRPVPASAGSGGLFAILTSSLTQELSNRLRVPFWVDTSGDPSLFTVHVELPGRELRLTGRQSSAYATNSHIFLVWMLSSSLVLIAIAILFLRNQIRPVLQLADAAESFGKGRDVPNFRPRGAREVRRAAAAFLAMKTRIERQIEQRTTMLAGVSHDLRTMLTRFKLELALLGDRPGVREISEDVDEMARMLEGYLAFARGDAGEAARPIDAATLIRGAVDDLHAPNCRIETAMTGEPTVIARPDALKRCLANLLGNAARFGRHIRVTAHHGNGEFTVAVEDDGPGIPATDREEVFRPFVRLDNGRSLDHGGSGLGLTIARDVARSHGGDLTLGESPLGGLCATLRIPA
jgi:two-component system osmolarity sensor histidine kinase EnvZ